MPYENYTIRTNLTISEVRQRFIDNIEPLKIFRFSFLKPVSEKIFEGKFDGSNFEIARIIHYRNGFKPIIYGAISEGDNESVMSIKMRLSSFVLLFHILILSVWCLMFVGLVIPIVNAGRSLNDSIAAFGFMFIILVLFYTTSICFFKYESFKARRILAEIFEAK